MVMRYNGLVCAAVDVRVGLDDDVANRMVVEHGPLRRARARTTGHQHRDAPLQRRRVHEPVPLLEAVPASSTISRKGSWPIV